MSLFGVRSLGVVVAWMMWTTMAGAAGSDGMACVTTADCGERHCVEGQCITVFTTQAGRDDDHDLPTPIAVHFETTPRKGLVTAGAILFVSGYALLATVALGNLASNGDGSFGPWLIPVAGPFIAMASASTSCADTLFSFCGLQAAADALAFALLAVDAVVQIAGVTMFALGYAIPKKKLVMTPSPIVGRNIVGVGLSGSF